MHEMSIARNIIDIVDDISKENQVKIVKKVKVNIGQLVAVVPDSLQFCYEAFTTGTHLENSELEIHIIPVSAECNNCKETFEVESYFFICQFCESSEIKILQGEELNVSELEVDA